METCEVSESPQTNESEESGRELNLGELLDKLCVQYMRMGVPYELFWFGDYTRLKFYKSNYEYRIKDEDEMLWLMGVYVQNAVASCIDSRKAKYPTKPIRRGNETDEEREAEKQKMVSKWREALNFYAVRSSKE